MPTPEKQAGPARSAPRLVSIYDDLRDLAKQYLSRQPRDHTLQPTALVHEVYLRLGNNGRVNGLDEAEFFLVAARAMRSVLVDHARRRKALKRGGEAKRLPLDEAIASYTERSSDLLALDEALSRLAEIDPELARVIDLRFFGGMTECETAEVLGVSARTIRRSWRIARLWLYRALSEGGHRVT